MSTLAPDLHRPRTARTASAIRTWIVAELSRSLNVDPAAIDTAAALDSLGVDSLAALGMTGGLAGWLDRDLPATLLWDYTSIDAVTDALADRIEPVAPALPSGVVELQTGCNGVPLFCFPGQRGHPVTFAPLAQALGPTHACYGLIVPGLHGETPPLQSVEAIAAEMVRSVLCVQPEGPLQLAGYSFGGLLAYEAARQLTEAGHRVSLLAIYDTVAPAARIRRPAWQQWALRAYFRAKRPGRFRFVVDRLRHGPAPQPEAAKHDAGLHTLGTPTEHWAAVRRANELASAAYRPLPFNGSAMLFKASHREKHYKFYKLPAMHGWDALARNGVRVMSLPGSHANFLSAKHAPAAAAALRPFLAVAAIL